VQLDQLQSWAAAEQVPPPLAVPAMQDLLHQPQARSWMQLAQSPCAEHDEDAEEQLVQLQLWAAAEQVPPPLAVPATQAPLHQPHGASLMQLAQSRCEEHAGACCSQRNQSQLLAAVEQVPPPLIEPAMQEPLHQPHGGTLMQL
jgi:hypothetical protein